MRSKIKHIKISIIVISLFFVINYLIAWTVPASAPTANNSAGPLNVGTSTFSSQIRKGSLGFTDVISASSGYFNILNISGFLSAIGTIQIVDGNQGVNKVLVSDNSGVARWVVASSLWTSPNPPVIPDVLNGPIGAITPVANGGCKWAGGSTVRANGWACVVQRPQAPGGAAPGDYYSATTYWDYYTCTDGYWVFSKTKSLKPTAQSANTCS
ncbi:MAG: hypothetical protein WCJ59_01630 [bacterium]